MRAKIVLIVLLIGARIVMVVAGLESLPEDTAGLRLGNDATRYHEIATSPGRPYRDFELEVPPVELGVIEAIDGPTSRTTAVRLAWLQFVLDLAAAALIWLGWGVGASVAYLGLGLPLATLVYFRPLDVLSVALTVSAFFLVKRGRDRAGGVVLALAVLTKVWPILLAPIWFLWRKGRAVTWFVVSLGLGVAAWVAWGGLGGPGQVLTFRGATGWHTNSTVGLILQLFTPAPIRVESGAFRIGTAPLWARGVLVLAGAAVVVAIYRRWRDAPDQLDGRPAVGVLATLMVLSPLFSEQYVLWLVPWAAIAWSRGDRLVAEITLAAGLLTAMAVYPLYDTSLYGASLLLVRNVMLCAMAAVVVWGGRQVRMNT